ncbi:prenyltransferase [Quisquiliibacterium transsilvanicum]|uniref:1,4-dihydroxy-2-naphthoate octaprenyltransferase n=1 Tax=Quisquiliibacterium transsilvanicum TaxID=1549638 RepID=A0A7W8HLQ1_9BURK|nr:prenyltransferase [Quisquiliibacterium transsilvanicum]MBB5273405.1 1,4-dihydroxy-2-naphthoate octaprenyltransferase [Quisquiliibacterium transsilvanicum]
MTEAARRIRAGWRVWLAATRPAFLGITAVAVLVGLAAAASEGLAFDPLRALLTLAGALLVHAGANVVNDFHDRHADAGNEDRIAPFTGGSRTIQDGMLGARTVAVYGYALLGGGALAGAWLALAGAPQLWSLGALGLGLAIAYSAPPLRLSGRGQGEWAIAAAWMLMVVGSDLVQRGGWSLRPLAAGAPVALLVAAILLANGFPDRRADAAAGKRTLVVLLGPARASFVYLAMVLAAHGWTAAMVAAGALPPAALVALASLPWSIAAAARLIACADRQPVQALRPALARTILAAHAHGLLLAAGLVVG